MFLQSGNADLSLRWNAVVNLMSFKPQESATKKSIHPALFNQLVENTRLYAVKLIHSFEERIMSDCSFVLNSFYHVANPILSADILAKITLQCTTVENVKTFHRYITQRQFFPDHLQFFREVNKIDVLDLRANFQRNFQKPFLSLLLHTSSTPSITFLMALSARPRNFARFLQYFEDLFLSKNEKVNLIITLFSKSFDGSQGNFAKDFNIKLDHEQIIDNDCHVEEDINLVQKKMATLQNRYPTRKLELDIRRQDFSRGIGLQEANKHVDNENEILFFCDVDLVFTPDFLQRIRRNTIQGQRVYYPVFFSQYDPDIVNVKRPQPLTPFNFEEVDGFWRFYSFGMFSIYKSDFDQTRGFKTDIRGWGLEDVEMVSSSDEKKD